MRLIFSVAILAIITSPSLADTLRFQIPSGQDIKLFGSVIIAEDCKSERNSVSVLKHPSNGKLFIKTVNFKIGKNINRKYAHCIGKSIKSVEVHYKSKKNFKGKDDFKIKRLEGNRNYNSTVRLRVR